MTGTSDKQADTPKEFVEQGVRRLSRHNRSPLTRRDEGELHFAIPDYSKVRCLAPQLWQRQFNGQRTPDVEKQSTGPGTTSCSVSPKCAFRRPHGIFIDEANTPGILRPDEQHNSIGRCEHFEHHACRLEGTYGSLCSARHETSASYHVADAQIPSANDESDGLSEDDQESYNSARRTFSSVSSYVSQSSDEDRVMSTNALIRYYANSRDDKRTSTAARRTSDYSTSANPWILEERLADPQHPLQAHSHERMRQGSAPPPYQSGSRRPSQTEGEALQQPAQKCRSLRTDTKSQTKRVTDAWEKNIYIIKLCKSFLLFGIQAHRLEEYLHNTAHQLQIAAEFQYVPHCMFMLVKSPSSRRNEIHLLKESTTVDLGKLEDVYGVYEAVVRGTMPVPKGIKALDAINRRCKQYPNIQLIILHGLAATCAGTFAFSARPIDFPLLFMFGCLLAILQLAVLRTPMRNSHVLEVVTAVIVAFCARALGSIYTGQGHPLFCFAAVTQGTIALILPGHIILAAAHEIQNRQVLTGAVKMIYAILYTLFLGFGILIGSAFFGFFDSQAVNAISCNLPWYWDTSNDRWRATYAQFIWVPIFSFAIAVMHQAKPRHLAAMVVVATCGHQSFYWSLARFAQNLQFAGMIAAFVSGLLANVYAHFSNSLAATVLLPAVLVCIPNALAASGSLVAGVGTADAIVANVPYHSNSTFIRRDFVAAGSSGSTGLIVTSGLGMVQATIGITVGLFLSAFAVYPFAKHKRTDSLAF